MNKKFVSGVILSAMVMTNTAVFAAEEDPMVIATNDVAIEDTIEGTPTIFVDNVAVDLSKLDVTQYIFDEGDAVMVPLRAVAEQMGFTVGWDNATRSVLVQDDNWEVQFAIGTDSYAGISKTAIGMTAPMSYGQAPVIVDNTTYVPADMFELLGYSYSAVGQFVNFDKEDANDNDSVQIPSPFVQYKDMAAVKDVLSYAPVTPAVIPAGYTTAEISVMDGTLLQLTYADSMDNRLTYRMAEGTDSISGDSTIYTNTKEVTANGITLTLRGNDGIATAEWTDGAFTYSLTSDQELAEDEVMNIIANIK